MYTHTATAPLQDQHTTRMAQAICETDWEILLQRLPAIDGYLPDQLRAAADRLRAADTAACEAIGCYQAAKDTYGSPLPEQARQLEAAEEALAACGYLHPSRLELLGETAERALSERHDARGALADLLFCARTVLDDAA